MTDQTTETDKPGIAARCARGLGTFNIAYGTIGLVCAAIIMFVLPPEANPLPRSMTIASSGASITAIAQGVLLRIYGPAVTGFVGRHLSLLRTKAKTLLVRTFSNGETA